MPKKPGKAHPEQSQRPPPAAMRSAQELVTVNAKLSAVLAVLVEIREKLPKK